MAFTGALGTVRPRPVEVLCSQETVRPPARKHALGPGPSRLAPRSAPTREPPAALSSPLPQSGALFSVPPRYCQSASGFYQTHGPALGTVPDRGLWRFCAGRKPDAHPLASTLYGQEQRRAGADPARTHPALLPLANPYPHGVHRSLSQGPILVTA